jgi:putative nucleotidyltransferase with HDIG domain
MGSVTQQSEHLRLLSEASQRLGSTLDLDEIYHAICDFMSVVAPNDSFFISAFDPDTRSITCHACWMENGWLDVSSFPSIPLEEEGRGTQSIAIHTGRSLMINDYQAQQKTAQTIFYVDSETGEVGDETPADDELTRSALIVPLKAGGVVKGVIQVMSFRQDAYTEDQLNLLEALAPHIASAEQNALLHGQVQAELGERKQAEQQLLESLAVQEAVTAGVIAALARTVEIRDPYTAGHQRRVSELAAALAQQMGLGEERKEGVRVAGTLHDVGKIKLPAEILSKPGRLTAIEFELIKSHAQAGYEILRTIRFPWQVADMALQHHERQDGSGYPQGLKGEEVLPEARMLAVADVVEAMASHRPYRAALGIAAALDEVRSGAGTRYDAGVAAACEGVFKEGFAFTDP